MTNINYMEVIEKVVRRDLRAAKRKKVVVGCFTALLSAAVHMLLGGWLLMLAIAMLSAHWWSALPTIGYWWAVLVTALLRGVFGAPQLKTPSS